MTTTIHYIDFTPELMKKNFWGTTTYETLETVLGRANEWVRRNYSKEILNIETVVLPNIYVKKQASTNKVTQFVTGGSLVSNFQIIRIWYKG